MSISLSTFVIQIINFLLLAYILYRVLYRPLRTLMEKRKRLLMEDIDKGMRLKEEAVTLKEKYEKLMEEADRLYEKKTDEALEAAEEKRREVLARAAKEAQDEKDKAEAVIESRRREMEEGVRKGAAEAAGILSTRILSEFADISLHNKLVGTMLEELEQRPPARQAGPESASKVSIASAYELDESRKGEFESLLLDRLGPDVSFEHKADPELVAGVRIWVDGLVLDGSIKGQLAAFVERAEKSLEGD